MSRFYGIFGRFLPLAVVLALLMVWSAPAAQVHAQEDSEFFFEADDSGDIVFSNVTLGFVDAGYGNYIAALTVTPTQEEIDELLLDEWSHVDFEFHFRGLEPSGDDVYFAPAVSDYVRQVGARVERDSGNPTYYAMGLNIELRWVAGEPITVLAPIFGYEPSGDGSPRVSVKVVSTKWWFADGSCEVAYERTTNEQTLEYCSKQDSDSRATLFDWEGDKSFHLR